MFDLVSTRAGTDPQTRGCAQLVAAVISAAIADASTPLGANEEREYRNRNTAACQALRFLFGRRSVFELYAALIGTDAQTIRNALTGRHALPTRGPCNFTEAQRRTLQQRLAFDAAQPAARQVINAEPSDVDAADDADDTSPETSEAAPLVPAAH